MPARLDELIEAQDLNGLLRAVDGLCEARAWDELLDLADRCEEALERGKQLWPISQHIDYRLALEAPGSVAALVLDTRSTRFALGPLSEVAASTHTWAELRDHIKEPQVAAYAAQERVLRGEVLNGDERAHPEVLELPLHLEEWEPTYRLATFASNHVDIAEPWTPRAPLVECNAEPGPELDEPEITNALLDLVQPWTSESNGAARAVAAEGEAAAATSLLTYPPFRIGALNIAEAVQLMAWAAASGGAHGRRRGAAYGRFLTWNTAALLADLDWPPDGDELARALADLRFFRWDEGGPEEGWVLRIAVDDPAHRWAAAIAATDILESGEEM
ncbi:MAG: hypothetical protein ACRDKB_00340 [Actinomycetota bacterium]